MTDSDLWPVLESASIDEIEPIIELLAGKSSTWTRPNTSETRVIKESVHKELLLSGGNSIINIFRGKGVPWKELVRDVARKVKIEYSENDSTAEIEEKVATNILERAIDKMTDDERAKLIKELENAGLPKDIPIGKGMLLAAMVGGRLSGFAVYKALPVIANAVVRILAGRGLAYGANMVITRGLSIVLGPIGWTIMGLLTVFDIAGPAWRITIPSVVMIGVLRAKQRN
jgi:uncharacterized protein YaaW (UPF0174 family)